VGVSVKNYHVEMDAALLLDVELSSLILMSVLLAMRRS